MERFIAILGMATLVAMAWGLSENKKHFPLRLVLTGVALQIGMGLLLLHVPGVVDAFEFVAHLVNAVIISADSGIEFVFGQELSDPSGPWGFVFAIRVLPVIIFFASLMALLYHAGIMQRLIAGLAWLLRRSLGVTGTEALVMASNVFVGQTEAPLCVRPYLDRMTRSQWSTLMVGGFATIAGSVLVAYVGLLAGAGDENEPARLEIIKHLLTASVLSAPAAFVISKIIVPETESPIDEGLKGGTSDDRATNMLDAAAAGASEGLRLSLNIGAMLIAFLALLALINMPLTWLGTLEPIAPMLDRAGVETLDLQTILGWLFTPLAWLMSVPMSDAPFFGSLLGQKLILTELVAYVSLGEVLRDPESTALSARSGHMAVYALCGFANFASIAIQIGGLTALAPTRRQTIVTLSLKAMIGGALASWMTACVAGLVL
ncbi:MAG: NupC/NupG family nucleoside CNT transporter [Phycisphaerales bacterium JB043]